MKKIIKTLLKSLSIILLILVVLGSSIYILGHIYQDKLKNSIIDEINQNININLSIGSAEVSVFRKFPFLSIILRDVVALSAADFEKDQFPVQIADTLFSLSRVYLQFNILDLVQENYRVRRAQAVEGSVILLTDRSGRVNYRIFKARQQESQNSSAVNLDGLRIKGIQIVYQNLSRNLSAGLKIGDITMRGKFSSNEYILSVSGSLRLDSLMNHERKLSGTMGAGLKLQLAVKDSLYKITKGDLNLNKMNLRITGDLAFGELTHLDLHLGAAGVELKTFLTALPLETEFIRPYKPSGTLDLLAGISGTLSPNHLPDIHVAYKLTNGKLRIPGKVFSIESLNLKGTYSNGALHSPVSSSYNISEYDFKIGESYLKGRLSVENLNSPVITALISGRLGAKFVSEQFTFPGFSIDKGIIEPQVSVITILQGTKTSDKNKISSISMQGNLQVKEVSGLIPGITQYIDEINGKIKVADDTWYPSLRARSGESDIAVEIEAHNVLGRLLFRNEPLQLQGDVYSHFIDLKRFVDQDNAKDTGFFKMPELFGFSFNYSADSLIYGKFRSESINSSISYKEGIFSIRSLEMKALRGRISADGSLGLKPTGDMIFRSHGRLEKLDINEAFSTFNNFGQKFIIAENLQGTISGPIEMSISTDNKLKPSYPTLILDSDMTITNGELINFEPVKQLSRYIALSELEHINFSCLKNNIIVQNSKVFIPQMDINSSAFNITASGIHGFDNYFEYKVRVNLSEILAGKARKVKKENEEFGIIENDGSGGISLHLAIDGFPDDFKVRYDKKETLSQIKNDLQKEKRTLKSIFKEEFGYYKDTSSDKSGNQKNTDRMIFDWGEDHGMKMEKDVNEKPDKLKKTDLRFEWE